MKKILISLISIVIISAFICFIYNVLTVGISGFGIKKDKTAKFELFYTSQETDPDGVATVGEVYNLGNDTILHTCIKNTNVYFVTINTNDKKVHFQKIIKNEEKLKLKYKNYTRGHSNSPII